LYRGNGQRGEETSTSFQVQRGIEIAERDGIDARAAKIVKLSSLLGNADVIDWPNLRGWP
jgi:hypothetical protein